MPEELNPSIETIPEQPGTPQPERIAVPEQQVEVQKIHAESDALSAAAVAASLPQPPRERRAQAVKTRAVSLQEIESILSRDLEEMYFQLPPNRQADFKKKGEEAAQKIKAMFDAAKVNAKKIARLIVDWLKIIPGVNSYFLEQESKIKTDEILALQR